MKNILISIRTKNKSKKIRLYKWFTLFNCLLYVHAFLIKKIETIRTTTAAEQVFFLVFLIIILLFYSLRFFIFYFLDRGNIKKITSWRDRRFFIFFSSSLPYLPSFRVQLSQEEGKEVVQIVVSRSDRWLTCFFLNYFYVLQCIPSLKYTANHWGAGSNEVYLN